MINSKKKITGLLAGVAISTILLTGCGGNADNEKTPSTPNTTPNTDSKTNSEVITTGDFISSKLKGVWNCTDHPDNNKDRAVLLTFEDNGVFSSNYVDESMNKANAASGTWAINNNKVEITAFGYIGDLTTSGTITETDIEKVKKGERIAIDLGGPVGFNDARFKSLWISENTLTISTEEEDVVGEPHRSEPKSSYTKTQIHCVKE